jgi:GNAT superfamily N-acetyltransferase
MGEYTLRAFESADRDAFLDLYAEVMGGDRDDRWFEWKYAANPSLDHVPIFVAETDGQVVGACAFFALELAIEGEDYLALQASDVMVDPEHQGNGLFTRLLADAMARYERGEPSFMFGFPNEISRRVHMKNDWKAVGDHPTAYRVQRPAALAGSQTGSTLEQVGGALAGPVASGYYWVQDARISTAPAVSVVDHHAIPVATLATLAERGPHPGIHARRDEEFYDWRFDNPDWDYTAYVAERDGDPAAAVVTGRSVDQPVTITNVTDVVPAPEEASGESLDALLARVVRDNCDADLIAAPPRFSRDRLARFGFLGDDRLPLSPVTDPTAQDVRTLAGDYTREGVDLTDIDNWTITFAEEDTS